ncbi:MAG: hypothetical protein KJ623_00490 [Nanoarchaeota archaeon]|nr:hypothetical protein [Nanoarchaeota archaeon]MBU0962373.1 hypothetical protein [Nanoarchaeota archaeon]
MKEIKKDFYENWEVSIIELKDDIGIKFKVTRRIPKLSVSETKMFKTKEEAKKQFDEWLN